MCDGLEVKVFSQPDGGCCAHITFPLVPLAYEYLALMQAYTFFRTVSGYLPVMHSWLPLIV